MKIEKGNIIIVATGKLHKLQVIHRLNVHWLDNEGKIDPIRVKDAIQSAMWQDLSVTILFITISLSEL